jgi:hypothetical protein
VGWNNFINLSLWFVLKSFFFLIEDMACSSFLIVIDIACLFFLLTRLHFEWGNSLLYLPLNYNVIMIDSWSM